MASDKLSNYTLAFRNLAGNWSEENLNQFLLNPQVMRTGKRGHDIVGKKELGVLTLIVFVGVAGRFLRSKLTAAIRLTTLTGVEEKT